MTSRSTPVGVRATVAALDADAVVATARKLGVLGWVRPSGQLHAEGAPEAVDALLACLGDALRPERTRVEVTSNSPCAG